MATYECSLHGLVVGTDNKDALIQRLVGICGNDSMIDLYEHEIVFAPSGMIITRALLWIVWNLGASYMEDQCRHL